MLIEIRKGGFVNKGAELMQLAVLDQLRRTFPEAEFAMAVHPVSAPYKKRIQLGFYQKLNFWRLHIQWGRIVEFIPRPVRELFGIIIDREIDIVIDIAGYSYGDQCAIRNTMELAHSCRRWKKNGTKVILMPQAFGPFAGTKICNAMRSVIQNVDLIFARDKKSYQHLLDLCPTADNILIAPDFTNLVVGERENDVRTQKKRICIVPNYRMIDKTSGAEREAYLPFLIELTKQICRDNHQVFFLIHEGKEDRRIADRINTELDTQLPVIEENDNLRIKGIIGGCDFVIASRFHALVSALSQGVPVLGTGWSHKYQMLFEDYGFPEGLVDVTTDPTIAAGLVDEVLTTKEQDIKIKLKKAAEQEKEKTKKMWMQVIDFISRN